ncbi:hypothetical protein OW763_08130 [Clostridium aestuarii]|uniref:Metal-binding protein n=1 Tax=Clostridium aestuarii TaxID=338193 RepID=A0ABT4CZB4_9CLOT|nr:hypothetical protein [Clostridium aestuarii]MCY6484323.1 hypothetical protein [Clostridium aestuarii]
MKIGVKYCGGCNPRYDRKGIIFRFKKEFGDEYEIMSANENSVYDVVVVLYGCASCCAEHENLKSLYGKIQISSDDDYYKITNLVNKINRLDSK